MVSKYEKSVWEELDFQKIQSTNEIKHKVESKNKKVISWFSIHKILLEYVHQGKAEILKTKNGLFWRKK